MPVPSAALEALEAAAAPPGGPIWAARIVDLIERGASASVRASDGSTLLHLFCRRCADATPAQLALIVAAHPAQRTVIDGHGRTPLHCLVSFATELTPEGIVPLLGDGGAAAVADADDRTPLHACADRRATVRPDVLAVLVAAHPTAREQRDAAGATPLDYARGRDSALGTASIALLAPGWRQGGGAEAKRPSAPRITAAEARGSEVWLSLSPPAGGGAEGVGARMLWYEIETIPLAPPRDLVASLSNDVPTRTVSKHRFAPRVAVGGLTDGASYAFRVRSVGLVGPGAWCRADAAGHPDAACTAPRPEPEATRRRNARAVVLADASAGDERAVGPPAAGALSATRPAALAVHDALKDAGGESGLLVPRALVRSLSAHHKTLDFEYEVRWRAHNRFICGAGVLSFAPRTSPVTAL
jgi:hypothetical protein